MVLFDPETDKATHFQSDESFNLSDAVANVSNLDKKKAVEYYNNQDY